MDHRLRTGDRDGQSGLALILGLFFTLIVVGLTMTGSMLLKSHITKNRISFASRSQALQVARSGLTEAVNWMRRQTSQPVLAFDPQLDALATPPILDTTEPDVGLVREFKITGKTWARYEVWKQWDADPNATRLAWRQQYQCTDISASRAEASAGTVWRLTAIGYVYERTDPLVAFNQKPNSIIASQVAQEEIRRLIISLPGHAAVNVRTGATCNFNANGRVFGGASAAGIYRRYGSGLPPTSAPPRVNGTPPCSEAGDGLYDDSYDSVFGMGFADLQTLANQVITNAAEFPSPVPAMALVVVDAGPITLDSTNPLLGTGIVIVRGDLTLATGSYSNFSGLLYVEGNLVVRSPSELNGSIICTGTMTAQGATDYATINFDEDVLNTLMQQIGTYRMSNTTQLPRLAR
jgi:hypothetical protein